MNPLHFSENFCRLRRDRGVTQEVVAEFTGVTKGSVSKWETGQSFPDITLLPKIAAFFDVTIDALLGYDPQLTKEEIQEQYFKFAEAFVNQPFNTVMTEIEEMVKTYYTCYPFLLQICILWMNHCTLADSPQRQQALLDRALKLCDHILESCKDIAITNDTLILKASLKLSLGAFQETVDLIADIFTPYQLGSQKHLLLTQAYRGLGQEDKARELLQYSMFSNLLGLVSDAGQYLMLCIDTPEICQKILSRTDRLIEIFDLDTLHPNTVAQYHYAAASVLALQKNTSASLTRLENFVALSLKLIDKDNFRLHGDAYFDQLDAVFEASALGRRMPRDRRLVIQSLTEALDNPIFDSLQNKDSLKSMKHRIQRAAETYAEP